MRRQRRLAQRQESLQLGRSSVLADTSVASIFIVIAALAVGQGVAPEVVASYNGISLDAAEEPLSLEAVIVPSAAVEGSVVRIPVLETAIAEIGTDDDTEGVTPTVYTVADGDTISAIA